MAALAGCLGGGGDTDETPTGSPTGTGTSTRTSTETPAAGPTVSPTATARAPETSTVTATPTPGPLVDLSGSYPAYRAGPGRRAFAPDAATPSSTAAVAYTLDLPAPVHQPVVSGSTVYLSVRDHDPGDPTVAAYDLRRGTRLWAQDLGTAATAAPSLAGERLVVGTAAGTYGLAPDGSVAWEVPDAPTPFPPAVTDERVFVAGERKLTALSHDGTRDWGLAIDTTPRAGPAADGRAVYVVLPRGDRSDLVAFDPGRGLSRWRATVTVDTGRPPVVAGETVYVASNRVQGGITAVSVDGGDPLWSTPVRAVRSPVVTDDYLVAMTSSGIECVDRADASEVWQAPLTGELLAGPVASADTTVVSIMGEEGTPIVLAYETATGTPRWSLTTEDPLEAFPAVVDGGLVTATRGESGPVRLLVVAEE